MKFSQPTKVVRHFDNETQLFVNQVKAIMPLPDEECTRLFLSGNPDNVEKAMESALPYIMKALWNQRSIPTECYFDCFVDAFMSIRTYLAEHLSELSKKGIPFQKIIVGRTIYYAQMVAPYHLMENYTPVHIPLRLKKAYYTISTNPKLNLTEYAREAMIPKKILISLRDFAKASVSLDMAEHQTDNTMETTIVSTIQKQTKSDVVISVLPQGRKYVLDVRFDNNKRQQVAIILSKYLYSSGFCFQNDFYRLSVNLLDDVCHDFESNGLSVTVENVNKYDYKHAYRIDKPYEYTDEIPVPDLKENLFDYQEQAYEFGMKHDSVLIADTMGLGKTASSIAIAVGKKQKFGFKRCLVICGVNSVKYNWQAEIHKFSKEECVVLSDSTSKKLKELNSKDLPYFVIINIEALRNQDIVSKLKEMCDYGYINMIIFDEIHKCLNHQSKQAVGALELNVRTKIALTGTPVVNNPMDSYFLFKWLNCQNINFFGYQSFYSYKSDAWGERKYINLNLLQENYSKIMIRRLKEDVVNLPSKIFIDDYVRLSPTHEKLYRLVLDDEADTEEKIKAKIVRLRQITCNSASMSRFTNLTPKPETPKIERAISIIEECLANNEKCVVFSNWTQTLDYAEEEFKKHFSGILRIDGSVSASVRQSLTDQFQHDSTKTIMLGTITAMGTGINLTAANNVIFLDEPFTNADKEQAIDRCHRIGTTKSVNVITLMCKDTIDEYVHDIVLGKKRLNDMLIDFKKSQKKITNSII